MLVQGVQGMSMMRMSMLVMNLGLKNHQVKMKTLKKDMLAFLLVTKKRKNQLCSILRKMRMLNGKLV